MLIALMSYSRPMQLANLLKQVLDLDEIVAEQRAPSVNVMSYLDSVGVVESPIRIGKKGRVRLCGVYWFARASSDRIIAIGETVKVVSRYGTTLNVEPIDLPKQLNLSWSESRAQCSSQRRGDCKYRTDLTERCGCG